MLSSFWNSWLLGFYSSLSINCVWGYICTLLVDSMRMGCSGSARTHLNLCCWFWLRGRHSGRWPERLLLPSAPWTQTGCLTISIERVRLQNPMKHLLLRCWIPECDMVTVTGMRSLHRTLNWPFSGQHVSLPAVPPKCTAQYDPRNWTVIFCRVKELLTH